MGLLTALINNLNKTFDLLNNSISHILVYSSLEYLSKLFIIGCCKITDYQITRLTNREESNSYYDRFTTGYVQDILSTYKDILEQEMADSSKSFFCKALISLKNGIGVLWSIFRFQVNNLNYSFKVFNLAISSLKRINLKDEYDLENLLVPIFNSGGAYYRFNQDGLITCWHPSSVRIYGFQSNQVLQKSATSTFIPNKRSANFKVLCLDPEICALSLNVNINSKNEIFWVFSCNFRKKITNSETPEINSIVWKINSPKLISILIKFWYDLNKIKFRFVSFRFSDWIKTHLLYSKIKRELRKSLKEKKFSVVYQPQIDPNTNKVVAVEALVRWNTTLEEYRSPDFFIPFSEKYGLIEDIDLFVLTQACEEVKKWQKITGNDIKVAVNISGKHFENNLLVQQVGQIITQAGISPEILELEITETWFLKDIDTANSNLELLKNLGISTSMDDFGTGSTGWSSLTNKSFDTLKIDKSYISNLEDFEKITILKTMISMGKKLGFRLVVEGVETFEQEKFLKQIGCDSCQGYLYSKPLSADELLKYLNHE